MKKIFLLALTLFFVTTLPAQMLNGAYVPRNDMAKSTPYAKFVFSGNKVNLYVGINGISLGVSYEYSYALNGNVLTMKDGAVSVEFNYNKTTDEISLNMEAAYALLGELGSAFSGMFGKEMSSQQVSNEIKKLVPDVPTWAKEGTFDPNNPNQNDNQVYYDHNLAIKCADYSAKIYNKGGDIQQLLKLHGYTAGFAYSYNISEDGVSFALAHKPVSNNEVELVVVIKGTTGNEWFGNMNIGENTERHKSFEQANKEVQQTIIGYINDYKLNNVNINFLVTGHSRGAAVANLFAVDLNEGKFKVGGIKSVVAYTFATPNNTKKTKMYDNIFNFCFEDDFVTQVPLGKWGYGKSGINRMAVAEELSKNNTGFKSYAETHNLIFNQKATENVIKNVYQKAQTISDYYNTELFMGPFDFPNKRPLYGFMRNYVAQTLVDGDIIGSAAIGLILKAALEWGNDVHEIAEFFVDVKNKCPQQYIFDTHVIDTYFQALKSGGFKIK